jgi:integrase/recombinase XerD
MEEFSMNRSTHNSSKNKTSISISKSIDGFLKFKIAEGLSQRTIDSYEYNLNQWLNYAGDQDIAKIKTSDLVAYFAWMRTEYKPKWEYRATGREIVAKYLHNFARLLQMVE